MTLLERIDQRLNEMEDAHRINALIGWSEDLNMLREAAARIRAFEPLVEAAHALNRTGERKYEKDIAVALTALGQR